QETFTVTSVDGTPSTIKVTINGTNDAATVSSTTVAVDETDKAVTTSGTLTSTDVDNPDNAFTPDSITGTHGNLTIDAHGHWVFTANSAFNQLNIGDKIEETFTVASIDGSQSTIKVTINGNNDRPTISGTSSGAVIEQGLNTAGTPDATGSLTATDLDKSDTITWAINQPQGQWGTLSIDQHGHWHYQLDNSTGGAADKLAAGEHQSDSFWLTATDSAGATIPHKIVIDVQGSNDKPIVSTWTQLPAGKEDQPVTIKASDLLTHASDVDTRDILHVTNLQATHGSLTDNKDGTYTFTPDKDFNGEIRLTYDVVDGHGGSVSTQAKFDLTAAPDNAIITDAQTNTDLRGVTEDRGYIDTHYQLHYDGRLNIQDPDTGEAHFDPNIGPQTYQGIGYDTKLGGHILLMRDGHYTYTLDNRNIQDLAQGEVKHDSAVIRSADGTTHTIELTVHGTNDAPVINAQSHSVTEDGQLLTGQMQGHDIDHGATLTYSIAQAVDGLTFNPDGSYSFDPSHSSYQHLAAGQQQTVTVPITVTDEHGDSATEQLVFTVTGTNDAPIVSPITDSVTEDSDKHHQLDLLQGAKDVEGDGLSIGQIQCTYHGQTGPLPAGVRFAPDGHTLVVDATDSNFQHLAAGEKETIVFHYQVIDSHGATTAQTATITVVGTDDKAQLVTSNIDLTEGEALKTYQHISDVSGHLSLTDPDSHDSTHFEFNIVQGSQNVGVLTIWPDGQYRYYVDPARNHNAHYAVNSLKSGETLTEHFQVKTSDGQTKDIAVTIHGEDNQAHLQVVDPKLLPVDPHLYEDKTSFSDPNKLYAGGIVRVHDPDHDEAQAVVHTETSAHGGLFQVGSSGGWSYTIDNNSPQVQNLGAGESFTDSFTIRSKDGSASQVISVTVHGTNDNPIVTSQVQLPSSTEDHTSTITVAQLLANSSDIDNNDAGQLSIANLVADHGSIKDNQDGTYTFTPDKDYNGQVHFTYDVKDAHGGAAHTGASMTLTAVGDAAQFSGQDVGDITEDRMVQGDADHLIYTTGVLNVSDPDAGQSSFQASRHVHALHDPFGGSLTIGKAGDWAYSVPNGNVQHLAQGETAQVEYEVRSAGGDKHIITVSIHGTNDAPTLNAQTHSVTEDGLRLTGQMQGHDIDHGAILTYSIAQAVDGLT
ncbi:TPA: tandem-95 repeat protein, partial [Vibrio vulnificus]|nr:tandem-95 repeat protein [Vibrio vulnificus]